MPTFPERGALHKTQKKGELSEFLPHDQSFLGFIKNDSLRQSLLAKAGIEKVKHLSGGKGTGFRRLQGGLPFSSGCSPQSKNSLPIRLA